MSGTGFGIHSSIGKAPISSYGFSGTGAGSAGIPIPGISGNESTGGGT